MNIDPKDGLKKNLDKLTDEPWVVPQRLSYFIRSPKIGRYEVILRLEGNVSADIILMKTPSLYHAEIFASKLELKDETITVTK